MTVEHWFDFICPYCYLAQDRNRILRTHGIELVEQGLQIHPEIGPGGTTVEAGGDADKLLAGLATTANDLLVRSERRAAQYGVQSTPTWIADGKRLSGLQTREWFEQWAAALTAPAGR